MRNPVDHGVPPDLVAELGAQVLSAPNWWRRLWRAARAAWICTRIARAALRTQARSSARSARGCDRCGEVQP